MRRIMIPMFNQPDVHDPDGVVYAKEILDKCVNGIHDPIPVIIENPYDAHGETIGHVSVIDGKYIIADLLDCKDKEMDAIVNKAVGMINEGEIKVWMNYIADLDQTYTYVKEMHSIAHFHLCNNAGNSIIIVDLKTHKKR